MTIRSIQQGDETATRVADTQLVKRGAVLRSHRPMAAPTRASKYFEGRGVV